MADITVTNIDEALWHTHTPDEIAAGASQDLRYCFLVDKALQNSHGLSLWLFDFTSWRRITASYAPAPRSLFHQKGTGQLHLPDGTRRDVRENDAVYIPENERHGLVNTSDEPLELIWIFPTDSFADVTYHYEDSASQSG